MTYQGTILKGWLPAAVPPNVTVMGDMCKLFVNLTSHEGKPVVGNKIMLSPLPGDPIEQESVTLQTDADGHAESLFTRGSQLEVVFIGTSFIRRIVVPDLPLADLLLIANTEGLDVYNIVRKAPTQIIRRS